MTDYLALFAALQSALVSHAQALGVFGSVNGHEPVNAPGTGVTCAFAAGPVTPVRTSGLAATSFRVEWTARVYVLARQEPFDGIDPQAAGAACALMALFSADFSLGGLVREVDLLGAEGNGLSAQPGWLEQDGQKYRVMEVTIPMVINDLTSQEA